LKRYELTEAQEKQFQAQYNELYFHTKTFWQDYRKLFLCGADIFYVDYLRWVLGAAETLKSAFKDEIIKSANKPRQRSSSRAIPGIIHLLLFAPFSEILDFRKELLKRVVQQKASLDRNTLARKLVAHQDVEKARLEFLAKEHGRTWDHDKWIRSSLETFIVYLVETYGGIDSLFLRQKHGDSLGNFFLTALSSHLRETTKNKSPHFKECGILLKRFREHPVSAEERRSTMNRVAQFKRSYSTIEEDVRTIQKLFPIWLHQRSGHGQ